MMYETVMKLQDLENEARKINQEMYVMNELRITAYSELALFRFEVITESIDDFDFIENQLRILNNSIHHFTSEAIFINTEFESILDLLDNIKI